METAEETKNLIRGIIDSYEMRVETVGTLMRQTIKLLKNFQRQQEEMAEELKNILAKTEFLRKKDFDKIMEEIWRKRGEREKKVHKTLESFLREEREMIDELRKLLSSGKPMRIADFMVLKQRILNRQREREKKVSQILKSFHLEQEELSTALRRLLLKGERVKIKDLKDVIRGLRAHRVHKQSSIGRVLEELEVVDSEVDIAWQRVMMSPRKNII
jgi:DNA-binding ferritin-like protein